MFEYIVYITLYVSFSAHCIFFCLFCFLSEKRRGMNELKLHGQKPASVFSRADAL